MDRLRSFVWVLLGLVVACTPQPPTSFAVEHAPPATSIERVLLIPMNFDRAPPTRALVRGTERVQADAKAYLEELGLEVQMPRLIDVMRQWHRASKETGLGKEATTDQYALVARTHAALVRGLAQKHEVDLVALPTIVVREGNLVGLELQWDGVTLPVPREGTADVHFVYSMAGKAPALSLRTALYRPDGMLFFERYCGLEPLEKLVISGSDGVAVRAGRTSVASRPRDDVLEDAARIREAVVMAFSPYLPAAPVAAEE